MSSVQETASHLPLGWYMGYVQVLRCGGRVIISESRVGQGIRIFSTVNRRKMLSPDLA